MFLGHFAAAMIAKPLAPKTSLGMLVLCAQIPDLVLPVLLLIGAEHVQVAPGSTMVVPVQFSDYPISHSLVGCLGWGLLAGLLYLRFTWYRRGAAVLMGLALSHWLLDVVSHRPDMPILTRGPYLGLGLWNSLPATMAVELVLFAAGVVLYARKTWPLDDMGRYGLIAFVVLLVGAQMGAYFGPPPPSAHAFAWVGLSAWAFVGLALWVERHRELAYDLAPGPRG